LLEKLVIKRAVLHVQSSGNKVVEGSNVLISIFSEPDSHSVYFLSKQDISRLDAVSYLSHGISKIAEEPVGETADHVDMEAEESEGPLESFTVNLKHSTNTLPSP